MAQHTLQHRFLNTVTFSGFDNTTRTIRFADAEGGNRALEATGIRPGGMDGEEKLAGLDSRDDMTLTKPYDLSSDPGNEVWLEANEGCPVSVLKQPLGANKIPVGAGRTKTGILLGVNGPDSNGESNDKATLAVVLGMHSGAA